MCANEGMETVLQSGPKSNAIVLFITKAAAVTLLLTHLYPNRHISNVFGRFSSNDFTLGINSGSNSASSSRIRTTSSLEVINGSSSPLICCCHMPR